MDLEFEVNNQILRKVETEEELILYNYNYNQYNCIFTFNNDEDSLWKDIDKFVIFSDNWDNVCRVHLGEEDVCECLVPSSMLNSSYFRVAVYGGDLVSTNNVAIPLLMSGYIDPSNPDYLHNWVYGVQNDIFVEIFKKINARVHHILYADKCLYLYNERELLESVYLPFITNEESFNLVQSIVENYFGTIPLATVDSDGLLSSTDKQKLDELENLSNVAWTGDYNDLENIPSEFTPKHHEHFVVDVTDYEDKFDIDLNSLLDLLGDEIAKE